MRKYDLLILILLISFSSVSGVTIKYHLTEKKSENDLINWTTGKIQSRSQAKLPRLIQNPAHPEFRAPGTAANLTEARIKAGSEAAEKARLSLMQTVLDLPVNGDMKVRDLLEMSGEFQEAAGELESYIRIVSSITGEGSVSETAELSMRGDRGLFRALSSAVRSSSIQIPVADTESAKNIQDPVTGIIIDATHLKDYRPSLLLRIYSQKGRLIYAPEMISRKVLISRGPAVFYPDYSEARKDARSGSNPYYLYAAGSRGALKADLFLDDTEVQRILSSHDGREALRKGSVVILVNPGR